MFSKVLIANRGEIACRIIRTCQRLGIKTAAVYSDADENALHVQMADEAHRIGSPPAAESYLRISRIIRAAKKAKADAIHPGYGFLSENPKLVKAAEAEKLDFIGPSSTVMACMGDKVLARRLAKEAGIPVIPGTEDEVDDTEVLEAAREVGYPLMVKAADGGGGMGIRLVESEADLADTVERARTQAKNAFDSSRLYLERHIPNASHVEVQIIADHHGNVVHLFERDCSIQRRHQKVIEETPCPKLTAGQRREITRAAVRLASHIGYTNAGTVEFLVDEKGSFYFLEVNARIQVEHPITEMITGLDLVELQLRVAAGEELPITQADVKQHGHALEARLYPEDPLTLVPTAGTVSSFTNPSGDHVRVDSALYPGYEIISHYEPLMAKLIVWGEDRTQAVESMRNALLDYKLEGVITNIPTISRVLSENAFIQGTYHAAFLEQLLEEPSADGGGNELVALIAMAMAMDQDRAARARPGRWKMHARRLAIMARLNGGMP